MFDILFNARVVAQSAHDALSGWRLGSCLLLDSFDVTSVLLTRFSLLIDKGFYDAVWEEEKKKKTEKKGGAEPGRWGSASSLPILSTYLSWLSDH